MQRPNVPPRNPRPMTPRGYFYAVTYPTEHYQYKDYNSQVIISPQQPVAGQALPYGAGYRWDYSYKPPVFGHPLPPQPMTHPVPQKKVLDIIDPNTGEKVDLTKVGTASKNNDPAKEQIRAQFASKVAAVAAPKKMELEDRTVEVGTRYENGMVTNNKEEEIESNVEIESVLETVRNSEEIKVVDTIPADIISASEEYAPTEIEVANIEVPEQIPMEKNQTLKETSVVIDKSEAVENSEPIKDIDLPLEDIKGDSDSEWKETKRSKKKKKAVKPEQQNPPKVSNPQQQPQHRQQKPVSNGTVSNVTNTAPLKDQTLQPIQQRPEVAPKEAQIRTVPAPKPPPVWPIIRSNLIPSSHSQTVKPPQAVQTQQQAVQPQQQAVQPQQQTVQLQQQANKPHQQKQSQQGNKPQSQQSAIKQQQQGNLLVNVKQQPNCKQPVNLVNKNADEQKSGGKRKSKEKNRNKKNSDNQKPKSPEPTKVDEATFVPMDQVAAVEPPREVTVCQEIPMERSLETSLELKADEIVVPDQQLKDVPEISEDTETTILDSKDIDEIQEIVVVNKDSLPDSIPASVDDTKDEKDIDSYESIEKEESVNEKIEAKLLEIQPASEIIPEDVIVEEVLKEIAQPVVTEYELEEGEIVDDEDDDDDSGEDAEKALLMKFKYSESQWSPLNPEGSKKYGRDFLLQIQQAIKLNRPSLPDLDIVLKEPHMRHVSGSTPSIGTPADFGSYVRQNSNSYGNNRGQNRGQNKGYEMRKVIEHRLCDNVVLHKSGDAWHRGSQRDEIDKVMCSMKSILNKLTPQNFESLMEQVKVLCIDCEGKLAGCIGLIFEQCIRQPIYSGLYAKMAKCFSLLTVPSDDDPEKTITFRKILLTKCQQEFEQDKENEREILAISEMIEAAEKGDERKLLEERKEEAMMNAKRRSLGNIRFIGELYKLNMLTEVIMHECLSKLLSRYEDEDNIECLCKLLTTIGKDIDNPKSKLQTRVDYYFGEMRRLMEEKKTTTRIKFMMMDVTDLRKRGWMQKHNEGPKTIEQIHKDVQKEKMEVHKRMEDAPRGARRQNSRQSNVTTANSEDGWTNVSRPPKSQGFDASKIKFTRIEDNIQLGPGRNSWNKGSTGGAPKEQQQLIPSNRYSLLSNSSEEPSRHYGSSKEKERYTGRHSGFSSYKNDRVPSAERASDDGRTSIQTAGPELMKNVNLVIPKEEMETKVKSRVEEYLMLKDFKEAEETMKELKTDSCFKNAVNFFYYSIEQNLEKSSKIREEIGVLHLHILKNRAAPVQAYAMALRKLARIADDLAVDVPQVWKYIGEIVSPVFLEGSTFKLNILIPITSLIAEDSDDELDSDDNDYTARLLAEVLNAVSHKMGHHQASELWDSSKMKWDNFVKSQPVSDFLKRFKVDYTVQSSDAARKRHRLISVNENKNELISLFSKPETTLEDIHDWIFENWSLSGQDSSNPSQLKHVSDCCTALCMSCLHKRHDSSLNEYDLDEERMKRFLCVVKSLTVDKQDRQLEVLFGLQELFHRLSYPKDLLHRLFELLFDAEVLNETAFHQWKEDTTRTVGKGVAISSVSRFYSWITEEEKEH